MMDEKKNQNLKSAYYWFFFVVLVALLLPDIVHAAVATQHAQDTKWNIYDYSKFTKAVKNTVTVLTTSGSDYYDMVYVLFMAFALIRVIKDVSLWMMNEVSPWELVWTAMTIIIVWIFMLYYKELTAGVWAWGDSIGFAVQKQVVGNTQAQFLFKEFLDLSVTNAKNIPETDPWDDLMLIFNVLLFYSLTSILQVVMFFVAAWGVWGYALSKLVGFIFLPFLFFKLTRPLFDGWLKLFLGFVFYNMFARIAEVIFVIYMRLMYAGIGETMFDTYLTLIPVIVFLLTGIFFLLSVSGFVALIVGGFSGMGGGAMKAYAMARMAKIK